MRPEAAFGLEHAAWPALLVNAGAAVLGSNAAAKTLFGTTLAGKAPQLDAIWPDENGCAAADFFMIWESSPAVNTDLKFRTADGSVKGYSTIITPAADSSGPAFLLQLFTAEDIPLAPKKIQVNPPPNRSGATNGAGASGDLALKQKLDCVLQLARTVSLDFNNALTGVLAHTSLLLGKVEPAHPWRRSLLEVEKSAARAAEIAGELAQFSRREKEAKRAPEGNLNAVVLRCVEFFQNAQGTRIVWKLAPERALFVSRFDEAKVQQALTKVLENAVEAFATGAGGTISVQTRNVELTEATQDRNVRLAAGTYVCVEISDTGTGIEADAMPRIFEPFFTTKRPPHRGLGLALVYGIITNHGGGVAISSQAGTGTSARVYLPAEKLLVDQSVGMPQELRGTGTILVVDDENLVLTMADTILTDFGYNVLTVNSGQKALNLLNQPGAKVDLVITDLVMPGMGGRELTERIRQTNPGLKVLPTSGYVMPEDKKAGLDYLQKPFTCTTLLRKVKTVLTRGGDMVD